MAACIFLVIILGTAGSNIIYKLASGLEEKGKISDRQFYALYQGISACFYGVLMLMDARWPSAITVICGVVAGVGLSLAALCYGKALQSGPYTVSAAMFNYSSFLVIVYSALFLNEHISPLRAAGLIILMALVYLIIDCSKKTDEKVQASSRWLGLILAVLLLNSIVRFLLRVQCTYVLAEDNAMMFIYFGTAALASLALSRMERRTRPAGVQAVKAAAPLAAMMALAVGASTWGQVQLPRLGVDAAIQYPIQCSGTIFVGALAGRLFFREKLHRRLYLLLVLSVLVIFGIYQF